MGGKLKNKSKKVLYVEIADTPSKRETGLMYRKTLGQNEGMLFKFPSIEILYFWMKNTYVPLDIAFIDNNGKIFQIEAMSPLSTKKIQSNKPCKYVLEVNRGWFKNNDIEVGNTISGIYFGNQLRKAQNLQNIFPKPNVTQNNQDQNVQNQQGQPQVKPEIEVTLSDREKIKYAEQRGLKLSIIYVSKDGFYVGPRILSSVPQENHKFPFEHGPNGEHFKAYDESPTLTGANFVVEGGHPKSFLLDGIVKLDVLDVNGQPLQFINGQPHTPIPKPELKEKPIDENNIKNQLKKYIPFLKDKQWDSIKTDVLDSLKKGFGIGDIAKNQILKFLNIFKK